MPERPEQYGASFLVDQIRPEDVVCPEDMSDDERLLMRSIREFAEQEVIPRFDEIDRRNIDVIRPLFKKAADLGLFMAEVPEALGGLGLSVLAIAGMSECRSYLGGLSSTVFAHQGIGTLPLINFGTSDQIARYLKRCMEGDLMAAFALTEPGSGSDAMNITTTAVLNDAGTHYIVNGAKQWITNAGWADLFILFAKVDGTAFSAFLLDRQTPGLSVGDHEKLLGLQGSSVCALQLDDVAIPVDNVLGEIGKGHKVALCTLNLGRMKMAANCAGNSKKILAATTQYAVERRQFGRPIAEFGLIQRKLADMAARAYGSESVAYRTAGLVYRAAEAEGGGGGARSIVSSRHWLNSPPSARWRR
jgi:alkylation response protein AidB-like acyl-CoA dehydrogenase